MPSPTNLVAGAKVGRYTIGPPLGEGGMARVYEAIDDDGRRWALKVLKVPHEAVRERLMTKGKAQARVRHVNVVRVREIIDVHGSPGLVMEYIEGPTLEDLVLDGPPSLDAIDALGEGLMDGVEAAHAVGLIHRDLKPANIMVCETEGRQIPKITDFGLARVLTEEGGGARTTRTGMAMGTPAFMAPEQIRSAKDVDQRADVYATGAVLYELATGVRAYDDPDLLRVLNQVAGGIRTPVGEANPRLPRRMIDAIDGAMAVDLDDRIPDITTLKAVWSGHRAWSTSAPPNILRWVALASAILLPIAAITVFVTSFSLFWYVVQPGTVDVAPTAAASIPDLYVGARRRVSRTEQEVADPDQPPEPPVPTISPVSPLPANAPDEPTATYQARVQGADHVEIWGNGVLYGNGSRLPPGTYVLRATIGDTQASDLSFVVTSADVRITCDHRFKECTID